MTYTDITYGGVTLYAENVTASKVPATRKQKLGNRLVMNEVFADAWDYQLVIDGIIIGTAAAITTARNNLIALQDCLKHAYTDGNSERDGNYVIVGSITWVDDARIGAGVTHLRYNLTLIQDQYD